MCNTPLKPAQRSISAVCGGAVGLPIIAQITGDQRYWQLSADLERFLRRNVEGRFWYTGMHPDLPPGDFEQDSVYAVVEYWLDKYDRTGDKECLDRAAANAYYGLLYWCPKQLSRVKSPTQCATQRAAALQPVFGLLLRQSQDPMPRPFGETHWQPVTAHISGTCVCGTQLNFCVQIVDGPYRGALTVALSPIRGWMPKGGFEWRGTPYTSESSPTLCCNCSIWGSCGNRRVMSEGAWIA